MRIIRDIFRLRKSGFVTEDLALSGLRPLGTSEVGDKVAELIKNDN